MEDADIDGKAERARRKKLASRLGWKLVGNETVEIKVERELTLGPRTIVLRGRVAVPAPEEISAEVGEALVAPLVDPLLANLKTTITRAATNLLDPPDDVVQKHIYESVSFFTAVELARRGIVREYQDLANRRVDERVETDLGLRFYLQSFTRGERLLEYFVGPTNSGKTYAAIEELRVAESGCYLAPLRLLALEVHERLRELGVNASLITGEERILTPGARHISSTVEMVDLGTEVDVAVIDEAQMLQDEQRGWAWTLALAGVRARKVILCGSADGLHAAQRFAARLGAHLAVRTFERMSPLRVIDPVPLGSLRTGDAVIAFSRNAVVELQRQISRSGRTTAAIYGSLSPVVRKEEAHRFRSGAADILVATDAIGLGLNLPIRRIIFSEIEKFDGGTTRKLLPPEVRQIAGRAGRYGIHDDGQVSAFDQRAVKFLKDSIDRFAEPSNDAPIWISPTNDHLRRLAQILGTTQISRLLQYFQTRVLRDESSDLQIADLSDMIEVSIALESAESFATLPLEVRAVYARAPVTLRGPSLLVLTQWASQHGSTGMVDGEELATSSYARDKLLAYEDRSRLATLYMWLALRFPAVYVSGIEILEAREHIDMTIKHALLAQGDRKRKDHRNPTAGRKGGAPKFDKRRLRR